MSGARRARMAEHGRGLERAARVLVYGGGAAAAVWVLSIFVRFAFWIPTRCLVGLGGGSVSVVWFGGAAGPRASPFGQTYAFAMNPRPLVNWWPKYISFGLGTSIEVPVWMIAVALIAAAGLIQVIARRRREG